MRANGRKLFTVITLAAVCTFILSAIAYASEPCELYDSVWKLINTKYVDQTDNGQNWDRWRHRYDKYIKTNDDSYVAIHSMIASLNDPYTKFLNPKEFQDETSSIKGSLKGIGVQIGLREGKLVIIAPIED